MIAPATTDRTVLVLISSDGLTLEQVAELAVVITSILCFVANATRSTGRASATTPGG